jgi:hypothetical protein
MGIATFMITWSFFFTTPGVDNDPKFWRRALRRRSERDHKIRDGIEEIADDWLPEPRILHPWPAERAVRRSPKGTSRMP